MLHPIVSFQRFITHRQNQFTLNTTLQSYCHPSKRMFCTTHMGDTESCSRNVGGQRQLLEQECDVIRFSFSFSFPLLRKKIHIPILAVHVW